MMNLPQIPYAIRKNRREVITFGGINYSDKLRDGDLADSLNLSARRFPYLSTRRSRKKEMLYSDVTALSSWESLIAVAGTMLLYGGEVVGEVTAGEKHFAVVGNKVVIHPDMVYLDLTDKTVHPMGAFSEGTGATFTTDTLTVDWILDNAPIDLASLYKAGDAVNISGCTDIPANNKSFIIKTVVGNVITAAPNTFTAGAETGEMTIERKIPEMDYICESENRLYGCSSKTQTIYASALGDPTNFNVFEGISTDSYAVAVGSVGRFTGCCKFGTSVLFWKETTLHKLLGSYPAEYDIATYSIEGLKDGCHRSIETINGVLYYMGVHGVYAYGGGAPSLISDNFGERTFSDAVGGSDGERYYLSCKEGGTNHLFVYETRHGLWVREDNLYCPAFARIGTSLYMLTERGDIYLADSGEDDKMMKWMAQFTPFYEAARQGNSSVGIYEEKSHSKIVLRVEVPKGSYLTVEARCDRKPWREVGRITGDTEGVCAFRYMPERCDKFELRLSGKGPATVHSLIREFTSSEGGKR